MRRADGRVDTEAMTLRASPKPRKSAAERLKARILSWTLIFCRADNRFRQGWQQWRTLSENHFPGALCFEDQERTEDDEDPYAVDAREALPRAKWCKDCIEFIETGIDYKQALDDRRVAKAYMKRAFKELLRLKPDLG